MLKSITLILAYCLLAAYAAFAESADDEFGKWKTIVNTPDELREMEAQRRYMMIGFVLAIMSVGFIATIANLRQQHLDGKVKEEAESKTRRKGRSTSRVGTRKGRLSKERVKMKRLIRNADDVREEVLAE